MPPGGRRIGAGRPRKPRELKVIEGTFRRDRDGGSPPVQGTFPAPPDWVSEAERQLWSWFPRPAWIGATDVLAVHAAVSLYALVLQNQAAMRATPDASAPLAFKVTHDGDGNERLEPKANPLYGQQLQLWARLMGVLATLGLTPADRGKMHVPDVIDVEADPWTALLG